MILRHEVAWEVEDLPKLLRSDVQVVHGRRQSGKTTELLRIARQRHQDQFAFICMNKEMAEHAKYLHWTTFTPIQRIDVQPASPYTERYWPLFLSATMLHKLNGVLSDDKNRVPVYVDEWNLIGSPQQREILDLNFKIAVTS